LGQGYQANKGGLCDIVYVFIGEMVGGYALHGPSHVVNQLGVFLVQVLVCDFRLDGLLDIAATGSSIHLLPWVPVKPAG
jgi:hypothetical protein